MARESLSDELPRENLEAPEPVLLTGAALPYTVSKRK